MLKRMTSIALCLALVGCGSSVGGTSTRRAPVPPGVAEVQAALARDYGLRDPRCEGDTRGGSSSHFVCLAGSGTGIELELSVTQAARGQRPAITHCGGARKIHGTAFVTCATRPVLR